jgi:hypothetical protein
MTKATDPGGGPLPPAAHGHRYALLIFIRTGLGNLMILMTEER